MKKRVKHDYKRFVEDYFKGLGSNLCSEELHELKSMLMSYSKRAKSSSPETFVIYLAAPLIGGDEGRKLQQEYKDEIEQTYSDRYGRYRLRRRIKPIFDELTELYNFCQDKNTGPIAKKHIEAMTSQWKANRAELAFKYQIKDRSHFISIANQRPIESKESVDNSQESRAK